MATAGTSAPSSRGTRWTACQGTSPIPRRSGTACASSSPCSFSASPPAPRLWPRPAGRVDQRRRAGDPADVLRAPRRHRRKRCHRDARLRYAAGGACPGARGGRDPAFAPRLDDLRHHGGNGAGGPAERGPARAHHGCLRDGRRHRPRTDCGRRPRARARHERRRPRRVGVCPSRHARASRPADGRARLPHRDRHRRRVPPGVPAAGPLRRRRGAGPQPQRPGRRGGALRSLPDALPRRLRRLGRHADAHDVLDDGPRHDPARRPAPPADLRPAAGPPVFRAHPAPRRGGLLRRRGRHRLRLGCGAGGLVVSAPWIGLRGRRRGRRGAA